MLVFYVLAVILFPFGIGPETAILTRVAAGIVWVTALLAAMLSLERLFLADFEDGSLDGLALTPLPLEAVVLAKCLAHWLTTGLPLVAVAPLLAMLLNLEPAGYATLLLAMLIGTPTLSLIGAIGAALALGARRGGALLSLLVLPLYVPVLIFGVAARCRHRGIVRRTSSLDSGGLLPGGAGAVALGDGGGCAPGIGIRRRNKAARPYWKARRKWLRN